MVQIKGNVGICPVAVALKPTVTPVTPFAAQAKPAPRYGGLVPPFYDQQEEMEISAVQICQACII
jgi:hypothetical protein